MAVDSQDRVYVFNRGEHPMMVFDRDGNLLNSWGEDLFHRAHGLHVGPDQTLYCTDDGDHTVRKCTLGGKVLLEIGIPGRPSAFMSGEPFNRCTHTALSPISTSMSPTGTRTPAFINSRRTASFCFHGANAAPIRASSTSRTISSPTRTAGSMSPTAKTTGYRFSMATGASRRSGTTCTAPAASIWKAAPRAAAMSANWGRTSRSIAIFPISGRASASCRATASWSAGWTRNPVCRRPNSARRMGSPSIVAAMSISAKYRGPRGRTTRTGRAGAAEFAQPAEARARAAIGASGKRERRQKGTVPARRAVMAEPGRPDGCSPHGRGHRKRRIIGFFAGSRRLFRPAAFPPEVTVLPSSRGQAGAPAPATNRTRLNRSQRTRF